MYSISKKITYGQLIGEINFPLFGYLYYIFNNIGRKIKILLEYVIKIKYNQNER